MTDIDNLVSAALVEAAVEDGFGPEILAARHPSMLPILTAATGRRRLPWSLKEDEFLRQNLGVLSEAEIGARLGRSVNAVHIRAERELDLVRPVKDPRYITTQKIAEALGVDPHKPVNWFERGILPGEIVPSNCGHVIRRVPRQAFMVWVINPMNWIWFDPSAVPDSHLHCLLELRKQRWGDEWWTTSQVAAYHGVDNQDVKRYIQLGKLKATPAPCRGGRNHTPHWSNWFILRSEATRPDLHFVKCGKGIRAFDLDRWSRRSDDFFLLAHAVGIPHSIVAEMAHQPVKRVDHRIDVLLDKPEELRGLVEKYSNVQYNSEAANPSARIFADWCLYHYRFPSVYNAMHRYAMHVHGLKLLPPVSNRGAQPRPNRIVKSILAAWLRFYARTTAEINLAHDAAYGGSAPCYLDYLYKTLRKWGFDPL
jgi:hypothetical protein